MRHHGLLKARNVVDLHQNSVLEAAGVCDFIVKHISTSRRLPGSFEVIFLIKSFKLRRYKFLVVTLVAVRRFRVLWE